MDVFTLTETEFFRQLTEGKNENLHIAYKDFVLQVSQICNHTRNKGIAITALLFVEVEISYLHTEIQRNKVSRTLASFVSKALTFVRQTLTHIKDVTLSPVPNGDVLESIGLNWTANKTALIELGYAFKLAECFGRDISVKEIVTKLAKVFNVELTEKYIYKKYNEIKVRGRNSRTYFMDTLTNALNRHMENQDAEF